MEPISENHTHLRIATLVPEDTPRSDEMETHWQKNQEITRLTLMEDFELGEEIQAGFAKSMFSSYTKEMNAQAELCMSAWRGVDDEKFGRSVVSS